MLNRSEHLLTVLAEEAGEVVQAVSKAIRFGLDETYEKKQEGTNAERLAKELADLAAVVDALVEEGVWSYRPYESVADKRAKREKLEHWMRYSDSLGLLSRPAVDPERR